MAEELIVGGAWEIVNRLKSLGFNEIGLLLGVKDEVQNLRGVLNDIQAVLKDAEKKQVRNESLRVWLKDLKQVAYDAEDVLDEISYEELRCSIIKNKVYNPFSFSNQLAVRFKIAHKIKEINKRLGAIDNRKNMFQLEPDQNDDSSNSEQINDRETSSFVDDSTVVGRESDKRKIVDVLICGSSSTDQESVNANNFPVIPIVSLGGLGKTTLAQLVYNDDVVKKHFDLRVWICVSNNFDTINLFAQILEQIPNCTKCESSSKQVLQNNLESQLKGKKFLLVLDDVWNEEQKKWDDLALPLINFCAIGSKIIVTTRSHTVASMVGAKHKFQLQILSDDGCWTLFERRAFMPGGAEKTSNLVEIGKEIVKKCKGVPLAAKVLGGLMHSKKEECEWLAVQNGEIWNITSGEDQNQIMKVLKLSYDNLPTTLKSCFSYCAIFPKDHWIERELLIQLWMAQGLLGASSGSKLMEDTGNTYFNILYSKSFFQEAEMNKFGDVTRCKMNDFVHDLAQSIYESECQVVGVTNKMQVNISKCRHATLISPTSQEALNEAKEVRTIFSCGLGRLVVAKSGTSFDFRLLRVLDLSNSGCSEFSPSIGELKHLRYLDLSHTSIKSLPKWVTWLYHLQTLILNWCCNLKELPEDFINLKNLRHLHINQYAEWKKMPREMGKLCFLQTLPIFMVRKEDAGCGIAELENLNELRGSLRIYDLHHVREVSSAKRAKLIEKRNMRELILRWSPSVRDDSDDLILKELQPHSNLKELSIENFEGVEFPRWVSSGSTLPKLVSITVSGCDYCEHIPSFRELPCLEELKIESMRRVKCMGGSSDDFSTSTTTKESRGVSQSSSSSYHSLKKLMLRGMESLEEWLEELVIFSRVEVMSIDKCPKLRKAPHLFPSLETLKFNKVGEMGVVSITSSLTSLTSLTIEHCGDLMFLTEGLLRKNDRLDGVRVNWCPKLRAFLPPNHKENSREVLQEGTEMIVTKSSLHLTLPKFVSITISGCDYCEHIPSFGELPCLKELKIESMRRVKCIGGSSDDFSTITTTKESRGALQSFLSSYCALKKLELSWMENLEEWLEDAVVFPCLEEMSIKICPKLRKTPHLFPSLKSLELDIVGGMGVGSITSSLTSLTSLTIERCRDLMFLTEGLLRKNDRLDRVHVDWCPELRAFLPPNHKENRRDILQEGTEMIVIKSSLRLLEIANCTALTSIPDVRGLTSLQFLVISNCPELEIVPKGFLSCLIALEELKITGCPRLKICGGFSFPSLQHITFSNLYSFSMLVEFGKNSNLSSLTRLHISNIQGLTRLPAELLQSLRHLQRLQIHRCDNFQGFLLTTEEGEQVNPCFDALDIYDCPSMSSMDLQDFVSLRELTIVLCVGLESLQGLQFLTKLEKLTIGTLSKQMPYFPLPINDAESNSLLPSLRVLCIYGWSALESLPDQLQHLTTLKSLNIFLFKHLTDLPEWLGNLTSLESLSIDGCENLMHLPSKEQMQRLTLLKELAIFRCPLLTERCDQHGGGPEWPKISHIPRINIYPH